MIGLAIVIIILGLSALVLVFNYSAGTLNKEYDKTFNTKTTDQTK